MSSYRCVFIMGVERALEYRMSKNVKANGGLIQKQNVRPVDQGRQDLHFHPLPQGKPPHLHIQQILHLQHLRQFCHDILRDISFSVDKGEMIGFLGPNGAGKTTTLKMLSGILYPTGGKVEIDGYINPDDGYNFQM